MHLDGSRDDHIHDLHANSLGPSPRSVIHSNALRTMKDRNTTSKISLVLSSRVRSTKIRAIEGG